jgi:hypothetical protein
MIIAPARRARPPLRAAGRRCRVSRKAWRISYRQLAIRLARAAGRLDGPAEVTGRPCRAYDTVRLAGAIAGQADRSQESADKIDGEAA